jgi:AAA+ ATPase superfamily predicted ATPase
MELPFLDRKDEMSRLRAFLKRKEGSLAVLYGRRRCGKSRLLQEAVSRSRAVYYLADEREGAVQRTSLAKEIARLLRGFDEVDYPDWNSLLERWWREARPGMVLILDEFPFLASSSHELPSLIQKHLDTKKKAGLHVILCGSSQRMMQGLVLDASAPLYGRASEILKIAPIKPAWICDALALRAGPEAVEAYSVWGGVPRYWELAAEHPTTHSAVRNLVLDPLGVLYEEPRRLLRDDLREVASASSILTLIGQGCHRPSEIAGRLQKNATSLSRPLQRLLELQFVRRDQPFGTSPRSTKRSLYRIADPFLSFWFGFVAVNRSRLEAHQVDEVAREIRKGFAGHVGGVWEDLVRASVAGHKYFGISWSPASSWWGTGLDRSPMQVDIVAESSDGRSLLVGEAEWSSKPRPSTLTSELHKKIENLPPARGRKVHAGLWMKVMPPGAAGVFTPEDVLKGLR